MIPSSDDHHFQLDDQLRRMTLLAQLALELREVTDEPALVEHVLRIVTTTMSLSSASLFVVTPPNEAIRFYCHTAGTITLVADSMALVAVERGIVGRVLQTGRSLLVNDVSQDPRWIPLQPDDGSGCALGIPILQGRDLLGVLTVRRTEPQSIASHDLILFEGVASQTASALRSLRRYQEERLRRDQAMALLTMTQFLTVERDVTDLARLANEQAQSIFSADYGLLWLFREQEDRLILIPPIPEMPAHELIQQHGARLALRSYQSRDILTEDGHPEDGDPTFMGLPLVHGGTVLGAFVLVYAQKSPRAYPSTTWSLLTIFTNVIAAASLNMQMSEKQRQYALTLEGLVTQRTHELQRSRDLLRIIFDHLNEGIALLDPVGTILAANFYFCRTIVGRHPPQVVGESYGELWRRLDRAGELHTEMQGVTLSDGQAVSRHGVGAHLVGEPVAIHEPVRVVVTDTVGIQRVYTVERLPVAAHDGTVEQFVERWRDITHQEELLRRLIIHEELNTLGRLAASVAHEVGNPLQSALGCIELCLEDSQTQAPLRDYMLLARDELDRMGQKLASLRNIYRPPSMVWEEVDLNVLLAEIKVFTLRQLEHSRVQLDLDLDEHEQPMMGQSDALRQVFLNIVLNAQEAMPHGGRIVITSRWLDEMLVHGHATSGWYIAIQDNGEGMNREQLVRLFEPFRTNKVRGVGLGLYLSKQIIEQHHGQILVKSVLYQGTTVEIFLPWNTDGLQRNGNHSLR